MAKPIRVVCAVLLIVLMSLSGLLFLASPVAAASHTWTSDTDFNGSGAGFTNTNVVGTGTAAYVEINKTNTDWADKNPSGNTPGWREGVSLAFSGRTNVTVLFGGYNGTYKDDTWEYDWALNTWTKITVNPHPQGRELAGMAFDSVQNVMVLYGGLNDTDIDIWLTDTWEYNVQARTWSQTLGRGTGPAMFDVPLAYDESAQRHVMFGANITTNTMQTWAYDASANSWTNRNPVPSPGIRFAHGMAYDAALARTVVFGGNNPFPPPGTNLGDTWEYNYVGNSWSQTSSTGPSGRVGLGLAYRPATSSIILFGGQSDAGYQQDTWSYSTSRAWSSISTVNRPSPRKTFGFAWDTKNDVGILYGGLTPGGRVGDTWSLGSAYWSEGKYASPVFDAGAANVVWQTLWWNKTPANQPANTILRFQIATSTVSTGPWNYGAGASCSVSSYYTVPGTDIDACFDNKRYFRFLADLITTDPQRSPAMEDVTINFNIPAAPPYIDQQDPANLAQNVPLNYPVTITFSEPMDTLTVFLNVTAQNPAPPIGFVPALTKTWSNGNQVLTLTHTNPWRENSVYKVWVTAGKDTTGDNLVPNPVNPNIMNPWYFTTVRNFPYIQSFNPLYGQQGVAWTAPIVVQFSEGMNTTTATWTLTPNNVALSPVWSNGDATLTLNHPQNFTQCTPYSIQINATDKVNLPLVPGPVPNPSNFVSFCDNPYIVSTSPSNDETDVALTSNVVVTFSEAMKRISLVFDIRPSVGGMTLTWSAGDTVLTMSHTTQFTACTVYTVNITATDLQDKPLIPNPIQPTVVNPWKFVTVGACVVILVTNPANNTQNVPQNQIVDVAFSKQMNEASVTVQVTPTVTEVSRTWDASVFLHIQYLVFNQCTRYKIQVTQGQSQSGDPLFPGPVPNPWWFDTICNAPYLTSTDPANNATLVPTDKTVVVNFNKAMNTTTVIVGLNPNPTGVTFVRSWTNGNTVLTLTHATPFADCTQYSMYIDGVSEDGNSIILGPGAPGAPNPWLFTTRCAGFYLTRTDPADQQQNVPQTAAIVVEFSQPVSIGTFTLSLNPTVTLDSPPTWTQGNTVVTVTHTSQPFLECRTYTATVTAQNTTGQNLQTGIPGSAPNPWTFKVHCIPPEIVLTSPANGDTGVALDAPIVVTFSEAMNIGTVQWSVLPQPPVTYTPSWNSPTNTVLTLTHPGVPFQQLTLYTARITAGKDVDGNDLVPGSKPNPWTFTTGTGLVPPPGLQVIRSGSDILLTWRSVPGASTYVVYSALNRFAAWPWPQIGTVTSPATSFFHLGAGGDGATHYYIVRARDSVGTLSSNSTMGVKAHVPFSYSGSRSNVVWMSLPYRSMWKTAKAISDELTSSQIDVVGKWDAATQTSRLWYYFRGAWRGENFPLGPGDGFYVGIRASFAWVINGTDGTVPHAFTFYPAPNANIHWISLPYTSVYTKASDIVVDIEGGIGSGRNTKIIEIARWDPFTQSYVRFSYTPTGWSGTDFTLMLGEGVYLRVVSTFTWTPRLVTPEVP